jgi:hypothetical protein
MARLNKTATSNKITLKETEASVEQVDDMLKNMAVSMKQMPDALASLIASLKNPETSYKASGTLTEVVKILPETPKAKVP